MTFPGDPRGAALLEQVTSQVETERRLERLFETHRRRQVRHKTLAVLIVLAIAVGLFISALHDDVEPVEPDVPMQTNLVLPGSFEVLSDNSCRGVSDMAGVEAGARVELIDLGARTEPMASRLTLPPGDPVAQGDERSALLRPEDELGCVFDLGLPATEIDDYGRVSILPFVPVEWRIVPGRDGAHAVYYLQGSTAGTPFFAEEGPTAGEFLARARDQGVGLGGAANLSESGSATFTYGPECERTVLRVEYSSGELRDLDNYEFPPFDGAGVVYETYHECSLSSHLEGNVETTTSGKRLLTRKVPRVEIIAVDPDDPEGGFVSVEVDLTWEAVGSPVRLVSRGDFDSSWGWRAPATVDGTILIDGQDPGIPVAVSEVSMTYAMGMYTNGTTYDDLDTSQPSTSCGQLNEPALDGPHRSPYPDADHAFLGFFHGSETVTISVSGPSSSGELVVYVNEFGAAATAVPGEVERRFTHTGAYSLAWSVTDAGGNPVSVDWQVSCRRE